VAKIKLTQREVDGLPAPDPSGKQKLWLDTELTGFGVLCSGVTTAKSYVVQRELPGRKTRRLTIGPTNVLRLADRRDAGGETVEGARRLATRKLALLYAGFDPKAARAVGAGSLRDALGRYLKRDKLGPASVRLYRLMDRVPPGGLARQAAARHHARDGRQSPRRAPGRDCRAARPVRRQGRRQSRDV
jgi:hypothetical protein